MGGLNFFLSLYISVRLRKRLTSVPPRQRAARGWEGPRKGVQGGREQGQDREGERGEGRVESRRRRGRSWREIAGCGRRGGARVEKLRKGSREADSALWLRFKGCLRRAVAKDLRLRQSVHA